MLLKIYIVFASCVVIKKSSCNKKNSFLHVVSHKELSGTCKVSDSKLFEVHKMRFAVIQ